MIRDLDAVERNKLTHRINSDAPHLRFTCCAEVLANGAAVWPHGKGPRLRLLQGIPHEAHRE